MGRYGVFAASAPAKPVPWGIGAVGGVGLLVRAAGVSPDSGVAHGCSRSQAMKMVVREEQQVDLGLVDGVVE